MSSFRAIINYDSVWDGSSYSFKDTGMEIFDKRVTFEQLLGRIYSKKDIAREKYELRVHFLWKKFDGGIRRLPITDDGDLKFAQGCEDPLEIYVARIERNSCATRTTPQLQCTLRSCDTSYHLTDNLIDCTTDFMREDGDFADPDLIDVLNGNHIPEIFSTEEGVNVNVEVCRDNNEEGGRDNNEDGDSYLSDWEKEANYVAAEPRDKAPSVYELPGMEKHSFGEQRVYCLDDRQKRNVLSTGSTFNSKEAMQLAIFKYALENKLTLYTPNSNSIRYEVECMEKGCSFVFRARRGAKGFPLWHVSQFVSKCTCLHDPDRAERRQVIAKVIGHMFSSRLSEAKFSAKVIMSEIRSRYAVQLLYSKAWRALQYAKDIAYGTHEESWQLLPSYLHMLKETNPGTVIDLRTAEDDHFLYSFFCLGQCIEGFKKYIRPVVAMDATHMKGQSTGIIFVAIGMDGSDCIYPIAFGFAPKETEEAWTWFLRRLRWAIGIREDLVLVTDRGSSIPQAVREVFPNVPHVSCYYHLKKNLLKYCRKRKDIQKAFRNAVYTHSREECETLLEGRH